MFSEILFDTSLLHIGTAFSSFSSLSLYVATSSITLEDILKSLFSPSNSCSNSLSYSYL